MRLIRSEPCMPTGFAVIRVPTASPRVPFPSPAAIVPVDRPPDLSIRVHALGLPLLFEVPSLLLPVAPRPDDPPAGVSSLFAASPTASTPPISVRGAPCGVRELPDSRFVPPSGFLNLSAACSVVGFTGLFHPAATSRVSPCAVQGLLPSRSGSRLVAGPCPLAVVPRSLTGDPAATCAALDFGASFCGAMRSSGQVINRPLRRSPLRLLPPAGPRFATVNPVPRAIRS